MALDGLVDAGAAHRHVDVLLAGGERHVRDLEVDEHVVRHLAVVFALGAAVDEHRLLGRIVLGRGRVLLADPERHDGERVLRWRRPQSRRGFETTDGGMTWTLDSTGQ